MQNIELRGNDLQIVKITLNKEGDFTAISLKDSTLFDRYTESYKQIAALAETAKESVDKINDNETMDQLDRVIAIAKENVRFSETAETIVDRVFGEGTIRKYFREAYEMIPTFRPDPECFIDFYEEATPKMEDLFNRKFEADKASRTARMAKYIPQDYKK